MNDSGSRRNDLEVLESSGTPFEELESLIVSLEFNFLILKISMFLSSDIDLDGVIDDQIDWACGVDIVWLASELDT